MKKIFLLGGLILGLSNLHAQTTVGLKIGSNLSTISGEKNDLGFDPGYKFAPTGGLYVNFKITDKIAIQPELLYSGLGFKTKDKTTINGVNSEVENKLIANYITEITTVQYKATDALYVEVGPEFSYLLDGKVSTKIEQPNYTNEIKRDLKDLKDVNEFNFGVVGGIGYKFYKDFAVTARYHYGITKLIDDSSKAKHQNISLMLSVPL